MISDISTSEMLRAKSATGGGAQATFFVVCVCALITLLEGFDIQAIGIAAPSLMPLLKLTPSQGGMIFGGGMGGFVIGSLLGGWLSDRIEQKLVLLFAVIGFGLSTLLTAPATDYLWLLAARFITGLGLGAAIPIIIAVAHRVCPERWRTFTVSATLAGMPLGGAIVAGYAATFMPVLGWKSLFYIGGIIPLALVPLIALLPKREPQVELSTPKLKPRVNWRDALFPEGQVLTTLSLWIGFCATLTVLYIFLNWLPSLVTGMGLTAQVGALCSLSFNLASIAGTLAIGMAIDRLGFRWCAPLCYAGILFGVFALANAHSENALLAASGAIGFFLLGAPYGLYAVVPSFYPRAHRGFGTGTAIGMARIGSILGPILGGFIMNLPHGTTHVVEYLVPLVVAGGLAALTLAIRARTFED